MTINIHNKTVIRGLAIKSWQLYILARLIDHEETWKYTNRNKWIMLDALGCMNNADFEKNKK